MNCKFSKSDNVFKDSARLIANGNIVGWFQDKMEAGPRALEIEVFLQILETIK